MSDLSLHIAEAAVFEVLRASAGSGKTFSLVQHYLAAALSEEKEDYYRHILAITFTNKAADEMKSRVLKAMRQLATGEGDHIETLTQDLKIPRDELIRRAKRMYHHMMTHYGMISIMTIDKFVNRLVRSFTRELAFDGDFRLELDESTLIVDAVDLLLNKVGPQEKELTKILEQFILQRIEDEDGWDPQRELLKFGELLFKEEFRPIVRKLKEQEFDFLGLQASFRAEYASAESVAAKAAARGLELIENHQVRALFASQYIPKAFDRWVGKEWKEPSATIRKQFDGEASLVAKKNEDRIHEVEALMPQLTACYEEVLGFVEGEKGRQARLKLNLSKAMFQLATLRELERNLDEVRAAGNVFTFSDLNRTIEILVRNSPAPFIFERIGERYHHFMIDEFQDTSVVQWQNFLPLIENSLAKGKFNLIVGDGKQAIYRWRNGDVRQLQRLPYLLGHVEEGSVMQERQDALVRYYSSNELENNWRSRKNVVEFNNGVFELMQHHLSDEHSSIYDHLVQGVKGEDGGYVTAQGYYFQKNEELIPERHQRIYDLIADARNQGFAYRDIAILVRSNSIGSEISRFLLNDEDDPDRDRIMSITEESLQLGRHVAPLAVIQLLKALNRNDDQRGHAKFFQAFTALHPNYDLVSLLGEYTQFPQPDEEGKVRGRSRIDLHRFLKDEFKIEFPELLIEQPLYDLVAMLSDLLGVSSRFPAYAEKLMDMALQSQVDDAEGLQGFLERWDQKGKKRSISIPEDVDGVRVMTVHKSKGLEFPVVISVLNQPKGGGTSSMMHVNLEGMNLGLPFGVLSLSKMKNTSVENQYEAEREREKLDELNVVYVSLTRAVDQLHILLEANEGADNLLGNLGEAVKQVIGESPWQGAPALGSPVTPTHEQDEDQGVQIIKRFQHASADDRLKIGIDDPYLRAEGDNLSPRARGEEVHALLARIESHADLPRLKVLPTPWQRMTEDEWQSIFRSIEEVLNIPEAQPWFDGTGTVYNERALIDERGNELRPDRIVIYPNKWVVIDYKTGEQEKKHHDQVAEYVGVCQRMTELPVEGWLLYTDEAVVKKV
ncbi:UvrD-helicase domain-containing protein [Sanyastnella coralliicola]|uniref:UvrD-helicase domain-containing protein n=1 Tax=Sanyastnella coralliicola TaxID=3069118 RepID=UPI0027B888EE|nr:UvrD-helicase domain-containing protein [Longitalea sp. SCSIO 12813]